MNGAQSPHFADQRGSASVVTRAKRMAQTGEAVRRPSCLIPGMSKHHENESAAFAGPLQHRRRCRQLALTTVVNTSQRGSTGGVPKWHETCTASTKIPERPFPVLSVHTAWTEVGLLTCQHINFSFGVLATKSPHFADQRGSTGGAERDHALCALAPHRSRLRLKAPCPVLVGSPAPATWRCATSLGRGSRKTH